LVPQQHMYMYDYVYPPAAPVRLGLPDTGQSGAPVNSCTVSLASVLANSE